jgi:hypothetical protein
VSTRAEQIAVKEAEQAKAGVDLKEAIALRDQCDRDIVAFRAKSMKLRVEINALREEEAKAIALRQAYALDNKKPLADALTSKLPQTLPASAFADLKPLAPKGKK